jgi:hypothetical protein
MLIKLAIVVMLVLIVGSLFYALFSMVRNKGQGQATIKALTLRITLSLGLFLLLMLGFYTGVIGH